jgi:predicted 3-demethylubiquinone-9 3-methyltransferase (glyoxalase superfamily)
MFTAAQAGKAETAVHFYTSVFGGSSIRGILRYAAGEGDVEGTVKHAQFSLGEQVFMATDSSHPHGFRFNEAISFFVHCNTQDEVDAAWNALSEGGTPSRCGWLKDQFGVSWQVVPEALNRLLKDPDPAKSKRVLAAMMKMDKIIIKDLEEA